MPSERRRQRDRRYQRKRTLRRLVAARIITEREAQMLLAEYIRRSRAALVAA